jgi:hypothetical protein
MTSYTAPMTKSTSAGSQSRPSRLRPCTYPCRRVGASTVAGRSQDLPSTYLAIEREARRRVEYWLTVLRNEGALADGDNSRRAGFLVTVLNGLSIARALPSDESILTTETETLHAAVDHVLGSRF